MNNRVARVSHAVTIDLQTSGFKRMDFAPDKRMADGRISINEISNSHESGSFIVGCLRVGSINSHSLKQLPRRYATSSAWLWNFGNTSITSAPRLATVWREIAAYRLKQTDRCPHDKFATAGGQGYLMEFILKMMTVRDLTQKHLSVLRCPNMVADRQRRLND